MWGLAEWKRTCCLSWTLISITQGHKWGKYFDSMLRGYKGLTKALQGGNRQPHMLG